MQVKQNSRKKGKSNAADSARKDSSQSSKLSPVKKKNDVRNVKSLDVGNLVEIIDTNVNSKKRKLANLPKKQKIAKHQEKQSPRKKRVSTKLTGSSSNVSEEADKNASSSSPSKKIKKPVKTQNINREKCGERREIVESEKSHEEESDPENLIYANVLDFSDKENTEDALNKNNEAINGKEAENITDDEDDLESADSENEMEIDIEDVDDPDSTDKSEVKDPAEGHIVVLDDCENDRHGKAKRFKCTICGKCSSAKHDLIKHIRIHTGHRPYKCKICNSSFIQITAFHGHVTIHTGEKPFKCDLCNKSFALKDRLRLHMRVHTGEKPHKCNYCMQTFARRSQVTQHQRVHTGKKAYQCTECNARFASYHTLKGHMMAHRGVKEFQCGACGKKFIRVEGMYKHIRTVHRGSRPYTCQICGKAFKGHLRQHMRLHLGMRPYQCSTCSATFTQNSQLTVHMRIHTGERPYKCQICGAAFAHSSACKIHMRSHTGEKPFCCILCSSAFAQLPHLKKHMKCVHNAAKPYLCKICQDYFQTQIELEDHTRQVHGIEKSAEEEAEEIVEEAALARLRNRLAVLLYRISSEERRCKFGFGTTLVDDVLKLSLQSSGHEPFEDSAMSRLDELRKNVLLLLQWTIPKDTMEEYHRNNMTVDEVLDMLTT